MSLYNIAVLITSFNRRELTLKSLSSLYKQQLAPDAHFTVFLVNDGCTDGTPEAVSSIFPDVRILHGDGSLFWNGGMRKAFEAAMRESFDGYLFLNDDTILYDDALLNLIACARSWLASGKPAIVVGSTKSSITGMHSYGGVAKCEYGFMLSLEKVLPLASSSITCDAMNGNIVLIPAEIARVVGNLEERFRHQFGDLDYGLRASKAGFNIVVAPDHAGECNPNSSTGSWRDPSMPFAKRWKHLLSPKGVPFREWLLFTRRHYGCRWPYYAVSPYFMTIASSLLSRITMRTQGDAALPRP